MLTKPKPQKPVIAIFGTGHIGASVGLAARHCGFKVVGVDTSATNLRVARQIGAVDEIVAYAKAFAPKPSNASSKNRSSPNAPNTNSPRSTTATNRLPPLNLPLTPHLVVIATPPADIAKVANRIMPHLPKGAIVTDTGSVKRHITKHIKPMAGVEFIGSHPVAGTEHSGAKAARLDLFQGRWCVLTPLPKTPKTATAKLAKFWKQLGMQTMELTPSSHDKILAFSSHLPHLVAFALSNEVLSGKKPLSQTAKLSAGGLRDFTRIAASDAQMWSQIFSANEDELERAVDSFIKNLQTLKGYMKRDLPKLKQYLAKTKKLRKSVIQARQH